MGLINWIKVHSYKSTLNKSNKEIEAREYEKAEKHLSALIGKYDPAVPRLAHLLCLISTTKEMMLSNLKRVEDLKNYVSKKYQKEYDKELIALVSLIESSAKNSFNNKEYEVAVKLCSAISPHRGKDIKFSESLHRYLAYEAFFKSYITKNTFFSSILESAVKELKQMPGFTDDVEKLCDVIISDFRYHRAIHFLLFFVKEKDSYISRITDYAEKIIEKKDSETKEIKSIREICPNEAVDYEIAKYFRSVACKHAKKAEYESAVLFDNYASEFISNDSKFDYGRCLHRLEVLKSTKNAKELSEFLSFAKSLNLPQDSFSKLVTIIYQWTSTINAEDALKICNINDFSSDTRFALLYVEKAKVVVKNSSQNIEEDVLKDKIEKFYSGSERIDVYTYFVNFIDVKDLFLKHVFDYIHLTQDSSLIIKYWDVVPSNDYFSEFVNDNYPRVKDAVKIIIDNRISFLCLTSCVKSFCKAVSGLSDESFAMNTLWNLVNAFKQSEQSDFYSIADHFHVYKTLSIADKSETHNAISILRTAMKVSSSKSLTEKWEKLVAKLIDDKEIDNAILEAKSYSIEHSVRPVLICALIDKTDEVSDNEECLRLMFQALDYTEQLISESTSDDDNDNDIILDSVLSIISSYGEQLHDDGKVEQAYEACDKIKRYFDAWLSMYIKLSMKDITLETSSSRKSKTYKSVLHNIDASGYAHFPISNESYVKFVESYTSLAIARSSTQPKEKAVDELSDIMSVIEKSCFDDFNCEKFKMLDHVRSKNLFEIGKELEYDEDFDGAIDLYCSLENSSYTSYFVTMGKLRHYICVTKKGDCQGSEDIIVNLLNSTDSVESFRYDLAYRFVCYLLKSFQSEKAKGIIYQIFPHDTVLNQVCENVAIKEAENILDEFNNNIERLSKKELSSSDAKDFLAQFPDYKKKISRVFPDTNDIFDEYHSKIESYILRKYFEEEKYADAFNAVLKVYKDFSTNPQACRNLAIASLGIFESDTLPSCTERRYKQAIAIGVSAIFTDKLFINSLDNTQWDNEYTFTLQDSLGKSFDKIDVPDNVNDDDPIENKNISIRETQLYLLNRLEAAVNKQMPSLSKFFADEVKSLEDLIEIRLDKQCVIATPFFASQSKNVFRSIRDAFLYELEQDYNNHEQVYRVGVKYGIEDDEFMEYKEAQEYAQNCISALHNRSLASIYAACRNMSEIKSYSGLFDSLIADVETQMDEDIKISLEYNSFLKLYEKLCISIDDIRLSLKCVSYVNRKVINAINDDDLDLRDGTKVMAKLYQIAPSHVTVKENLKGMLSNLAVRGEMEADKSDISTVSEILSDIKDESKDEMKKAVLHAQLSKIIDCVNHHTMEESTALEWLYDVYMQDKLDDRICENLVTLCDICHDKYRYKYAPSVTEIFNALRLSSNRSVVFNKKINKMHGPFCDSLRLD